MHSIDEVVAAISRLRPASVVALTGAGVSAESGVPIFRGPQGLWERYRPEDLATPEAFARDPLLVWRWYEWRREKARAANPNDAHYALADLERRLGDRFTLITQNVDGLHARAGSRTLIEFHGNFFRARCTAEGTVLEVPDPFETLPPRCACGALLRPDVVWFGEGYPPGVLEHAVASAMSADLMLVIGTSGVVQPAAGLVGYCGGASVEINPEATPISSLCTWSVRSVASKATRAIVDAVISGGTP